MYLIEYFKTNGKTCTLRCEFYSDVLANVRDLVLKMEDGIVISFNVEILK